MPPKRKPSFTQYRLLLLSLRDLGAGSPASVLDNMTAVGRSLVGLKHKAPSRKNFGKMLVKAAARGHIIRTINGNKSRVRLTPKGRRAITVS